MNEQIIDGSIQLQKSANERKTFSTQQLLNGIHLSFFFLSNFHGLLTSIARLKEKGQLQLSCPVRPLQRRKEIYLFIYLFVLITAILGTKVHTSSEGT